MTSAGRALRVAAAVAILALSAAAAVVLAPVYYRSVEFGRALQAIARDAESSRQPDDAVRAAVLDHAARLSLPIDAAALVLDRAAGSLRIDVNYRVPVDVVVYTVDLHFHSHAGR